MNDALLEALRQQAAGGGGLEGALAGMAGDDPALGLLSQMLAQREQTLTQDLETQQREEERLAALARAGEEARQLDELRQLEEERRQTQRRVRLERLRLRLEELEDELAGCHALLDGLALALGACPSCWGEDPGCRLCRGRGQPGFVRPEAAAFRRLVAPALEAASFPIDHRPFAGCETPELERRPL
ncbi:hypothetical protein [Deinococcus humi]|uniref:Uncharacterized protein n=1 Tax=Deinococcus humi TaxID=662880 RepID=A0A7W8NDQ9_9DEIO|nr:hypothetical protein [Deinococcus humi]MBB5363494.1 hypothetical protein [Deinococcus humi]GGO30514.1 hypothetical protein GCM10008949_25480 [Deinococcus humi]